MLSAESASGRYPVEAVSMMSSIIAQTEDDPHYRVTVDGTHSAARADSADAIGSAMRSVANLLHVACTVAYTSSGYSALRMARERPESPIIGITPRLSTARQLALAWGVHPVLSHEIVDVTEMTDLACETAREQGFAKPGQTIVISAGMPFGNSGTTNLLRIAQA